MQSGGEWWAEAGYPPTDRSKWYSTLYPGQGQAQFASRFRNGPNSSWDRCNPPLSTPKPSSCMSLSNCEHVSSLDRRQLAAGGCFRIRGVHRVDRPLELPCPIKLLGHGAVVSGGAQISGWHEHLEGGKRYMLSIPMDERSVRQLFIGGPKGEQGPLQRVRQGSSPTLIDFPSSHPTFALRPTAYGYAAPRGFCEWAKSEPGGGSHLEAVYASRPWDEGRCAVVRVTESASSCEVIVAQPCHHNICPGARVAEYNRTTCNEQKLLRLDNVHQNLALNQWVQRPDGRVLLRTNSTLATDPEALQGELRGDDGSRQLLLTPQSEGLLRGLHIAVEGVRFVLSAFSGAATNVGWGDTQAGQAASGIRDQKAAPRGEVCPVRAAVVAEHGRISNCTFGALGGAGVHVRSGVVEDSEFVDLSGGAVLLGTLDPEAPSRGTVRCNVIRTVGLEYTGTVGIAAGYVRGALIQGNLVTNLPYTAISVGWGWAQYGMCPARDGALPGCTNAANNVIENNAVVDICHVNHDGGAIYTLGQQPNTTIRRNCIVGVKHTNCVELYNDDGSLGITSEHNLLTAGSHILIKGRNDDPTKGNPVRDMRALACDPRTSPPRVIDLPANEPGSSVTSPALRATVPLPTGFTTDPNAVLHACGGEHVCSRTIEDVCGTDRDPRTGQRHRAAKGDSKGEDDSQYERFRYRYR